MNILAAQPTLPGLESHLSDMKRSGLGIAGEMTARLLFERAGYAVRLAGRYKGDLTVIDTSTGESWNVEVKTARQGKDHKWRFTLVLAGNTGSCNHRHADKVLLLAVLRSGRAIPFLIPVEAIADKHHCVITSHPEDYSGKLAQYRQRGNLRL